MPQEEKGIQRYDCETEKVGSGYVFYEQGVMEPWPEGEWVRYSDHLDALGEEQRISKNRWRVSEDHRRDGEFYRRRLDEADAELQSLRADIAYVRGHLEGYASMLDRLNVDAHFEALPDALREDAERLRQAGGEGS